MLRHTIDKVRLYLNVRILSPREDYYMKVKDKNPIRKSRAKVSKGIQLLYELCYAAGKLPGEPDPQGIVSISFTKNNLSEALESLSPEEQTRIAQDYFKKDTVDVDDIGRFFPDQLKEGVTIYFTTASSPSEQPPVCIALQEKIKVMFRQGEQLMLNNPKKIHRLQRELAALLHEARVRIKALDPAPTVKVISLLAQQIEKLAFIRLYRIERGIKENEPLSAVPIAFQKMILKNLKKTRSSNTAILAINARTQKISYAENATITAHDRCLDSGDDKNAEATPNLRAVYAGKIALGTWNEKKNGWEKKPKVTIITVAYNHGNLVPLEELSRWHKPSREVIKKTRLNALGVIRKMAQEQLHGSSREYSEDEPLKVDWLYQLLTSNVPFEYQATAKKIITEVFRDLNGQTITMTLQGQQIPVQISAHLFNASGENYWPLKNYDKQTLLENERTFHYLMSKAEKIA